MEGAEWEMCNRHKLVFFARYAYNPLKPSARWREVEKKTLKSKFVVFRLSYSMMDI